MPKYNLEDFKKWLEEIPERREQLTHFNKYKIAVDNRSKELVYPVVGRWSVSAAKVSDNLDLSDLSKSFEEYKALVDQENKNSEKSSKKKKKTTMDGQVFRSLKNQISANSTYVNLPHWEKIWTCFVCHSDYDNWTLSAPPVVKIVWEWNGTKTEWERYWKIITNLNETPETGDWELEAMEIWKVVEEKRKSTKDLKAKIKQKLTQWTQLLENRSRAEED